jgi:hypothetical protein
MRPQQPQIGFTIRANFHPELEDYDVVINIDDELVGSLTKPSPPMGDGELLHVDIPNAGKHRYTLNCQTAGITQLHQSVGDGTIDVAEGSTFGVDLDGSKCVLKKMNWPSYRLVPKVILPESSAIRRPPSRDRVPLPSSTPRKRHAPLQPGRELAGTAPNSRGAYAPREPQRRPRIRETPDVIEKSDKNPIRLAKPVAPTAGETHRLPLAKLVAQRQ